MARKFIDNVPVSIQNTIALIVKFSFSNERIINVCLKFLAVVEGKEDGKVTQLIILQ